MNEMAPDYGMQATAPPLRVSTAPDACRWMSSKVRGSGANVIGTSFYAGLVALFAEQRDRSSSPRPIRPLPSSWQI
ncbi:hypothetical protein [Candidatus Methylomirabilis sp.]|uniref:hypothetical protein n=1 Tax=Candidatus Methylomirabilis sp. TaxID=2032687 RepID=UPI00307669B2